MPRRTYAGAGASHYRPASLKQMRSSRFLRKIFQVSECDCLPHQHCNAKNHTFSSLCCGGNLRGLLSPDVSVAAREPDSRKATKMFLLQHHRWSMDFDSCLVDAARTSTWVPGQKLSCQPEKATRVHCHFPLLLPTRISEEIIHSESRGRTCLIHRRNFVSLPCVHLSACNKAFPWYPRSLQVHCSGKRSAVKSVEHCYWGPTEIIRKPVKRVQT